MEHRKCKRVVNLPATVQQIQIGRITNKASQLQSGFLSCVGSDLHSCDTANPLNLLVRNWVPPWLHPHHPTSAHPTSVHLLSSSVQLKGWCRRAGMDGTSWLSCWWRGCPLQLPDRGEAAAPARVPAELPCQPRRTMLSRKELAIAKTYFLSC